MRALIVVPTYGQMDISQRCVTSALSSMPVDAEAYVCDDCSPDWKDDSWQALPHSGRTTIIRRPVRSGSMTQAWNEGLAFAEANKFWYVILANSDLVFPQGWWEPIQAALEKIPHRMVGPMTNAPGSRPEQDIRRLVKTYKPDDSQESIDEVQAWLNNLPTKGHIEDGAVNGFCIVARTLTWRAGAFSAEHVFDPRYKLAGNEDEWQKRVERLGRQSGRVMGSFVFHYRGSSRGLTGSIRGFYRRSSNA